MKIQWIKPSIKEEMGEIERTAEAFDLPVRKLASDIGKTGLAILTDAIWSRLENTDSWSTTTMTHVNRLAKKYGRDVSRIVTGFEEGKAMPAPIILIVDKEPPYLVGGNTRLMVARAMKIRPQAIICRIKRNASK